MRASTILRKLPFFLMLVVPLVLAGCEGDPGPAGPQGPEGPEGPEGPPGHDGIVSEYTFVGTAGTPCLHCHATVVNNVLATKHNQAYADLEGEDAENPYCLQCHTTGWDSPIAYGETEILNPGPDLNGFDNYWGVETELAADRRAELAGVQCESCHGAMGPTFNDHAPPVLTMATVVGPDFPEDIVSPCYPCHSTQFSEDEYLVSGHGTVLSEELDLEGFAGEFGRSSCDYCHSSEGFVKATDPDYATMTITEWNLIGCVTCHDPHQGVEGGGNEAQLRYVGATEVAYTFPYEPGDPEVARMDNNEYGPGNLCAKCHHGRRNTSNVQGQINNGTAHFGPHESPQMDMFLGAGCYEIADASYDRTHSHQNVETACVQCHMRREVTLHGELQEHSFHSFAPDPGNCAGCHPNLTDFDYSGGQTEVEELMNELATRFGYADVEAMMNEDTGWSSVAAGVTVWQREAAYALYFVHADGSKGVHNPDYAKDLLENAIEYYDENDTPAN